MLSGQNTVKNVGIDQNSFEYTRKTTSCFEFLSVFVDRVGVFDAKIETVLLMIKSLIDPVLGLIRIDKMSQ